jgi:hypothetical protein
MPSISETSAGDISFSPAWSIMIIFLFGGSQSGKGLGLLNQRGDVYAIAGAFGQAARPDRLTGRRLATVKNLSRETTVGGREQQQGLNSHDELGNRNPKAMGAVGRVHPCDLRHSICRRCGVCLQATGRRFVVMHRKASRR